MKSTRLIASLLPIAALLLQAGTAAAQGGSYGVEVKGSALLTSDKVGAGDLTGVGGRIIVAPTPWTRIGIGASRFGGTVATINRRFTAYTPAVDFEGTISGSRLQVLFRLSPSLLVFNMAAAGAAPKERLYLPALAGGLGFSAPLVGPFALSAYAEDVLSYARQGVLESVPAGKRQLGHSPRFEAGLSLILRKREKIARFEDLPISFANDFQPVRVESVQDSTLLATGGREHEHVADGVERTLEDPKVTRRVEEDMLLGTVFFKSGSFDVDGSYEGVVRDVASFLKANPDTHVAIRGFTSPAGSNRYNLTLAERRANKVRDQLVYFYQIDKDRVDAVTGGIDPDATKDVARRVEIRTVVVRQK